MSQDDERIFESEVRRVARALWPRAAQKGALKLDGRERDGVFDDGDLVHVVEATTSRKKDKVDQDLDKSTSLIRLIRQEFPHKQSKIWIVTAQDPTADQNSLISEYRKKAKCPIEVLSFHQFTAKIIDSAGYLARRINYAFGSIRNPQDDRDTTVPENDYIPLELVDRTQKRRFDSATLTQRLLSDAATVTVILGDYGSGKSMTLWALFDTMRKKHLSGKELKFPIYLNLRDHYGQTDPAEALLRHGTKVGYPDPSQLVAAWRAGFVFMLLDGFDEVSATRLVRGPENLRKARRQATYLAHSFVTESPRSCAVVISGRLHYFDQISELTSALGLRSDALILDITEFTQEQVGSYLARKGINGPLPDWLPARPLLLGYLAVRDLLSARGVLDANSKEEGWDYLLDRVCEREARQIDPVTIEPETVREFLERLATRARITANGRGPIVVREMAQIFETVFDMNADEKVEIFLLRLPGLTSSTNGQDAREFMDEDLADASRAGDVVRYALDPYNTSIQELESVGIPMGELGIGITSLKYTRAHGTNKQLSTALQKAAQADTGATLAMDLVKVTQGLLGFDYVGPRCAIHDGFFEEFELNGLCNLRDLHFQSCYFMKLYIADNLDAEDAPRFEACEIDSLIGSLSPGDMPTVFDASTNVANYVDHANTNADIMNLALPTSVKVLMTMLRKLYFQAGGGRKENAFYRGLEPQARAFVQPLLQILQSMDFARPSSMPGPRIWIPNRSHRNRAQSIISAPHQSTDELLLKTKEL